MALRPEGPKNEQSRVWLRFQLPSPKRGRGHSPGVPFVCKKSSASRVPFVERYFPEAYLEGAEPAPPPLNSANIGLHTRSPMFETSHGEAFCDAW